MFKHFYQVSLNTIGISELPQTSREDMRNKSNINVAFPSPFEHNKRYRIVGMTGLLCTLTKLNLTLRKLCSC